MELWMLSLKSPGIGSQGSLPDTRREIVVVQNKERMSRMSHCRQCDGEEYITVPSTLRNIIIMMWRYTILPEDPMRERWHELTTVTSVGTSAQYHDSHIRYTIIAVRVLQSYYGTYMIYIGNTTSSGKTAKVWPMVDLWTLVSHLLQVPSMYSPTPRLCGGSLDVPKPRPV